MNILVHLARSDNATINIAEQSHFDGNFLFMIEILKDKIELQD